MLKPIIHSEWYKGGIGSDEFTGSVFDARNMTIRDNIRCISLSRDMSKEEKNKRGSFSNVIALSSVNINWDRGFFNDDRLFLTNDGGIESETYGELSTNIEAHGSLYYDSSKTYIGGKVFSNGLVVAVSENNVGFFKLDKNYLSDTILSSYDMSDWIKGASWTGTTTISIGSSDTRSNSTISVTGIANKTYKISVMMGNRTGGNLRVKWGSTNIGTISGASDKSYTFFYTVGGTNKTDDLILEPLSGFGGDVKGVLMQEVDTTQRKLGVSIVTGSIISIVKNDPFVYIATANKVYSVDTSLAISAWTAKESMSLSNSSNIIGMSVIGQYINVYVNDGNDGIKYIWDGISKFPAQKVIWNNQPIDSVEGNGNEDYMISSGNLYITAGYQRQQVIKNKRSLFGQQERKFSFQKILGFNNDLLYIASNNGYYVYGSAGPGLPVNIMHEQILDGQPIAQYLGVMSILVGNATIMSEQTYNFTKKGYFIDNPVSYGLLGDQKAINKIRVAGYIPDNKTKIRLSICINDTFYLRLMVNGLTEEPEIGAIYKHETIYSYKEYIVIGKDIVGGSGEIYFKTIKDDSSVIIGSLTKISGIGQNTLSIVGGFDCFIPVKTITKENAGYFREYIESKSFIDIQAVYIHKLQLRVDIDQTESEIQRSPAHITDIIYYADIIDDGYTNR